MEAVQGVESLAGGDGRNHISRTLGTALLISVGYIDLGKWVAAVDAGARFGYDLVLLVLFFNFSAVLNQYLSTCIGMVTGQNLAEISHQEYSQFICVGLGLQAGMSLFTSELTMDKRMAGTLNACIAGFTILCFVLGLLISQPKITLHVNVMLPKFSGESAYSLMALMGANIMSHNFYVHSSIVQVFSSVFLIPSDYNGSKAHMWKHAEFLLIAQRIFGPYRFLDQMNLIKALLYLHFFVKAHVLKDGHITQAGKYEHLLQAGTELSAII